MRHFAVIAAIFFLAGCVSDSGRDYGEPVRRTITAAESLIQFPSTPDIGLRSIQSEQYPSNYYTEKYAFNGGWAELVRIQKVNYYMRRPAATDLAGQAKGWRYRGQPVQAASLTPQQFGSIVYAIAPIRDETCFLFRQGVAPQYGGFKAILSGMYCEDSDGLNRDEFRERTLDYLRRVKWRD
ncbi:hypothetical protein [Caenispirillum salinarum]|uniref:hypothetical protein n=1 Tax=Caenispirillum salinarum TaxID=859058 RepID=UPI00384D42F8